MYKRQEREREREREEEEEEEEEGPRKKERKLDTKEQRSDRNEHREKGMQVLYNSSTGHNDSGQQQQRASNARSVERGHRFQLCLFSFAE